MKPRLLLAAGTVIALAGCMQSVPVTQPPVTINVKSSSADRPIYGFTEPTVRSFVSQDGKRTEVTGARCSLDSAEFAVDVVTPAIVRMPIVKGRPTTMRVNCTTPTMAGGRNFAPSLQGTAVGGASTAGLVAAVVSTAIVAGRDRWSYTNGGVPMSVELKPRTQ